MNHNYALLYKQICYVLATVGYTFVVTALIAKGVDMIPGLHLRAGPLAEALGMDEVEVGAIIPSFDNRYSKRYSSTGNSPLIISNFVVTSLLLLSFHTTTNQTIRMAEHRRLPAIVTGAQTSVLMTPPGQRRHVKTSTH